MNEIRAVIADDEAPLRESLRRRLSEVWPELVVCGEAQNGEEALTLIERHRPQVAFLDIRMPGLTGLEVAGRNRRLLPDRFRDRLRRLRGGGL